MTRLPDDEIDRIASRVVAKVLATLAKLALVVVLGVWILPIVVIGALTVLSNATRALPQPVAVAIVASVLAAPVVALVLVWSRRARRRS